MHDREPGGIHAFLKDVGRYPLLKHEEHIRLFRVLRDPKQSKQAHERARTRLLNCNMRLVVSVAKLYKDKGVPLLDLIQEGSQGLMKAIDKFDPERGYRLSTYARWWIRQAVIKHLTEASRTVRLPAHIVSLLPRIRRRRVQMMEELGRDPSIDELAADMGETQQTISAALDAGGPVVAWDPQPNDDEGPVGVERQLIQSGRWDPHESHPDDRLLGDQLRAVIRGSLDKLTAREEQVIRLRFGLIDPADAPQWEMTPEEREQLITRMEGEDVTKEA